MLPSVSVHFFYILYSLPPFYKMVVPAPTLPCTFIWDMMYTSIKHDDPEALDGCPLLTNLAIARYLPNARGTAIRWIIDRIFIPIQSGNRFWFHFEFGSNVLLLGKLFTVHAFLGSYALIEISPILHLDWKNGWMTEEGSLFWINVDDLVLDDDKQQRLRE